MNESARRLLIVGCGDLGVRVGRLASAAGWRVFGMRRSAWEGEPGIEPLRGDVVRPETLAFPPCLDAVVYAVAADERSDGAYRAAYPEGLGHVLGALGTKSPDTKSPGTKSPGTRVLFVSSTGVYGESEGAWVDEDTEPRPAKFTGKRMREAELVLAASPFKGSVLRLGGIYGPGRTRLVETVRAGTASASPDVAEWTNRIHAEDAVRAVLHALGLRPLPKVLNVVDKEPAVRRAVLDHIADQLGVARPEAGQGAHGQSANKRVRGDRLLQSGFAHVYPTYREGYRALLRPANDASTGN